MPASPEGDFDPEDPLLHAATTAALAALRQTTAHKPRRLIGQLSHACRGQASTSYLFTRSR